MSRSSNHVEQITVTVILEDGECHTLAVHKPAPYGHNPRFLAQQMAHGMADLAERLDRLADTYGEQARPAPNERLSRIRALAP